MPLLVVVLILSLIPSVMWLLLRQVQSPWWLENMVSTPFIIVFIFSFVILALSYLFSYQYSTNCCLRYYIIGGLVNLILAVLLNNMMPINRIDSTDNEASLVDNTCREPVHVFQFNMKYQQGEHEVIQLLAHLIAEQYQLVALQGVSQHEKRLIIEKLSPHYPYFITGENAHQQVTSDQLLFSQYGFSNIKYYKNINSAYLISSQWHLPLTTIDLYSLHPPSPRNESLWQTRNKTLYQLKSALKKPLSKNALVIGDLNLSKHSNRMSNLTQDMNTVFVNSWPNKYYLATFMGLAIDHFWVSKPTIVCSRNFIDDFSWSDHYAVKTQVDFKSK